MADFQDHAFISGLVLLRNGVAPGEEGHVRYALNASQLGWGNARHGAQIPLAEEEPFLIDLGFNSPHLTVKGEFPASGGGVVQHRAVENEGTPEEVTVEYVTPNIWDLTNFCNLNRYDEGESTATELENLDLDAISGVIEVEFYLPEAVNNSITWEAALRTAQFEFRADRPGLVEYNMSYITKFPRVDMRG